MAQVSTVDLETPTERRVEKALIGVAAAVVTSALVWMGGSVNNSNEQVKLLALKIEFMTEKLDAAASDRYTASQATKDWATMEYKHARLMQRVERCETKLDNLQSATPNRK